MRRAVAAVEPLESRVHLTVVPSGFAQTEFATGLSNPTAMAFAPDGRLFVSEQAGRLRVVKDGVLLSKPFLTLNVDSSGERGLLGVTFDPDFSANHFVYVYWTVPGQSVLSGTVKKGKHPGPPPPFSRPGWPTGSGMAGFGSHYRRERGDAGS